MFTKTKINKYCSLLVGYFIIPFCTSTCLILLAIYNWDYRITSIKTENLLLVAMSSIFIAGLIWFKKIFDNKKAKELILQIISPLFSISLVFLAIEAICKTVNINLGHFNNVSWIIHLLSLFLCILLLYTHRNSINVDQGLKRSRKFYFLLAIISIFFVVTRIGMPLYFSGGYIDESSHILSGEEFAKSGNFIKQISIVSGTEIEYTRGAQISLLLGILFKIFGLNLFIAKLVPGILGIINFALLYKISTKLKISENYILILMLIYLLSPLVIINQFYIRMFVFYEFIALINTYLAIKLLNINTLSSGFLKISLALIVINGINIVLSHDNGSIFPSLVFVFTLIYIYFFRIQKLNITCTNSLVRNLIYNNKFKIILFTISAGIISYLFNIPFKIWILLHDTLAAPARHDLRYDYLFFDYYSLFSIFFVCTSVFFTFVKNTSYVLITSSITIIFLIHLISSGDLQVTRGILYFLPLFFLGFTLTFQNIQLLTNTISKVALIVLILTNLVLQDITFVNNPSISNEVIYNDFGKITSYLNTNCSNRKVLVLSSVQANILALTYKNQIDYVPYVAPKKFIQADISIDNDTFPISTRYSKIQVISSDEYENILKENKVCIVANPDYSLSWRYISKQDFDYLESNMNKVSYIHVNIYTN